ncbi:tetratricopeptide repeat protein [Psychrobacter sp. I-STPA10]|uniref:tetratricopeptide repeat protein n=1 Tax=Psychrobacter sp. I-STPA10 TaxID=2585769 RepID=UPI001E3F4E49|nr:tetratricopeptide repeat protein [Psychrobacter sp. I-STPA10]
MKLLKAALFTTMLSCGAISAANAELISNVPLDTSRFELMNISSLTNMALQTSTNATQQRAYNEAKFYLGRRYHKGNGVAQNTQKAIEWYTLAANEDITPAQLNLGLMYAKGDGVAVNEQKARYWLERAAKRSDNRASYALALIDEKQQKLVDAYKWYDLATRDGMLNEQIRNKARGRIGRLALNLSSSDMERARTQAESWFQTQ